MNDPSVNNFLNFIFARLYKLLNCKLHYKFSFSDAWIELKMKMASGSSVCYMCLLQLFYFQFNRSVLFVNDNHDNILNCRR